MYTILIENQTMCTAHSSFESSASSFSPLRSHSSHSPRRFNYIKERACMNLKCKSSFHGSQFSSTSPTPSLTSGYARTSSDQVLGNSQSYNSKVMATSNTRSCTRPVLVRHPSLPDNEDEYEKIFSEKGDFPYSDFDQSSLVSEIGNLEMDNPKFLFTASDPYQNTSRQNGELVYIKKQKSSPTL